MKQIRIRYLKDYERKFGLNWKIKYFFCDAGDKDHNREPHITSIAKDRVHEIHFGENHAQHVHDWKFDFVHELGHAFLAENIDPIFATMYLDPGIYNLPDFQKKANYLFLAWIAVLDTWVNDAVAKIDKSLILWDIKNWIQTAELVPEAFRQMPGHSIVTYAVTQAEIQRLGLQAQEFNIQEILTHFKRFFGESAVQDSLALSEFCAKLERLSIQNKKQSLELLNKSVQQAIEILRFPVKASLIKKEIYCWEMK